MRKFVFAFILIGFFNCCFSQTKSGTDSISNNQNSKLPVLNTLIVTNFITNSEAEKIIGSKVHVSDSMRNISSGYLRNSFTYKANVADSVSNNFSTLFFSLEQYPQLLNAQRAYTLIKNENLKNVVVTDLKDVGDEGFITKDQFGFPFIMIRKNEKTFKFKLRYSINKTYNDELMLVAKKIVSQN